MNINPNEMQDVLFAVRADALARKGKISKAIKLCKRGIKSFPDYPTAYMILSDLYIKKKQKKYAVRLLNSAVSRFPQSKLIRNTKASAAKAKNSIYHFFVKPAVTSAMLISFAVLGSLALVPAVFPEFSSRFAESLRNMFSTRFVAELEELSFTIEDYYNQVKYNIGDKQQLDFDDLSMSLNLSKKTLTQKTNDNLNISTSLNDSNKLSDTNNPANTNNISIKSETLSDTTWTELLSANGETLMYRKKVNPDPERPYSQIFFVKIRADKINIHLETGGKIPVESQNSNLLAAFNGGFRYVHGNYGLKTETSLIHPPKNNIGTLIMYKNGTFDIVKWNSAMLADSSIIAYRQNCPLMVENNQVTKDIKKSMAVWGFTIDNKVLTWRSGVGISADKKWLIYAFGKSLSVASLAGAFAAIGAYNAIQLDINRGWTKFVLFNHDEEISARKIVNDLYVRKYEYLKSSSGARDFFYLTLK